MTDIERLIHKSDGTLESDVEWFCKPGQKADIFDKDVSGAGYYASVKDIYISEAAAAYNRNKLALAKRKQSTINSLVIQLDSPSTGVFHAYVRGCRPIE